MKVFANGIGKSGNNLLLKLLRELGLQERKPSLAATTILGRHTFARAVIRSPLPTRPSVVIGLENPVAVSAAWLDRALSRCGEGYLPGHCAYSGHLTHMLRRNGFHWISIIRDPRDVVVSAAQYLPERHDLYVGKVFEGLTFEQRLRHLILGKFDGRYIFDGMRTSMARFDGWLQEKDGLVIRFEDLVGDGGGGSNNAQIQSVSAIVKFLRLEDVVSPQELSLKLYGGTKTFRGGQIGAWKSRMTDELLDLTEEALGPMARRWGYQ